MLEAVMEECVYNEGNATGQETNMGFETKDDGHTHYCSFCWVILSKSCHLSGF